ncbi:type VI secretion system baseplate subunit TssF [Massilia sp. S19_KUP03_FR1]|uniref:type VI secretion system baseplate subunit TssF n=1 Tax=Massilia sp. S19_KUP03_FR1 TaxID=3025503 RepID=UPI002FCD6D74
MIDDILPYYEREHASTARMVDEFIEQYPQLAGVLGFDGNDCSDPSVQRIIAAMVMMGATILKLLDDNYPQFTGSLLSMNYPHFTQPFPSTSIARFDASTADAKALSSVVTVPRGACLHASAQDDVVCKFDTVYPVTLAPVRIDSVRCADVHAGHHGDRMVAGATALIDLTVSGFDATRTLAQQALPSLRVYIDGEPSLRACVRDLLFMHTLAAYVNVGADDAPWTRLEQVPLAPVGFRSDEAVIPFKATSHPAYRILLEYFACPEKFNFFDIDMALLCSYLPAGGQRVRLRLAVDSVAPDSSAARILRALSTKNFLLACTPIVNLFPRAASPVDLTHTKAEYAVLACAEHPAAYDIHSVSAVRMVRDTPKGAVQTIFHPYYSLRHGMAGGRKGHYYTMRRDATLAGISPGHEMRLALVDSEFDPLAVEAATVSIALLCTNRDLPSRLPLGQAGGDLRLENCSNPHPVRLLRKPTPTYRFSQAAQWRLIAQIALSEQALTDVNLEAFTELLMLHNLPQSNVTLRQIGGVTGFARTSARAWMPDAHGGARQHGVGVRMTVDESAFVGSGIHVFAQVIDHFLGHYAQLNTFIQLTVVSHATGKELIRCAPRSCAANLA